MTGAAVAALSARRRTTALAGVAAVGALALALRLLGLRYGLPAVYNPDEVAIMSRALGFAKGDLNPHNFLYPTLYFYALFAWIGLSAIWAVITGATAGLAAFQRDFFVDPTRVYVAGRLLTALCGTATVVAAWRLTRDVAGGTAATCAALLLAVAPLHVRDSHYVKHDVPATLLVVLAYVAYARIWMAPALKAPDLKVGPTGGRAAAGGTQRIVIAAAITGAAFSTHYYTVFLAIPLAWSALHGASTAGQAVRRVASAAIISAAVFFLLSPFLLVEPGTALRDIQANRAIVVDRAIAGAGYWQTAWRYAAMLWQDSMGWPVIVLAGAGIVVAASRDLVRTAWLLSFAAPFLLLIASTFPASRYLIPVLPFIALFAGIAIAGAWQWRRVAGAALLIAATLLPLRDAVRTDLFIRQTDTRTLAARYLERRIPAGATILIQPYSVPVTPTAEVLREAVQRTGKDMPLKTRLEIARSPYPSPAYRVLYLGRGLDADKIYIPYDQLNGRDPLQPVRADRVAFVVWKRYNRPDPATLPFLTALAREGRRVAVFSPYRDARAVDDGGSWPEPFLHNTDARIDRSLERPGPVVEIWQLNGARP